MMESPVAMPSGCAAGRGRAGEIPDASSPTEDRIGSGQDASDTAILDRLAAMEDRPAAHRPGPSDGSNTKPSISPHDAELANRRLSSMFPNSTGPQAPGRRIPQARERPRPSVDQPASMSSGTSRSDSS
jgi:hypothetical protein